jgi:hypothetical protein
MPTVTFAARRLLLSCAAIGLAACGGDGATAPEADLTPAEAADVLEALTTVSSLSNVGLEALTTVSSLSNVGPVALRSVDLKTLRSLGSQPALTEQLDESIPCPEGGSTRARGAVTVNDATGAATIDVRQTYTDCAVRTESNRTWTINGDPDIRTIFSSTASSFTGSLRGAVVATSAGTSGRCTVDVTMSLTASAVIISGTVCGESVADSISASN